MDPLAAQRDTVALRKAPWCRAADTPLTSSDFIEGGRIVAKLNNMAEASLNHKYVAVNSMIYMATSTTFRCQVLNARDFSTTAILCEVNGPQLQGLPATEAKRAWDHIARGMAFRTNKQEVRGDPHHTRVYTVLPRVGYKADIIAALARDHP
jgi:hypothetical protein